MPSSFNSVYVLRLISILTTTAALCAISCREKGDSAVVSRTAEDQKPFRTSSNRTKAGLRDTKSNIREATPAGPLNPRFLTLKGAGSNEILESITRATNPKDLAEAYSDMVDAFSPEEWSQMLDFVAILPPGENGMNAFQKAINKLAAIKPEFWLTDREELQSRFTDSQLRLAGFRFAAELGKTDMAGRALDDCINSPDLDANKKRGFMAFLFAEWAKGDPSSAIQALAKIPDEGTLAAVIQHNNTVLTQSLTDGTGFEEFKKIEDPKLRRGLYGELGKMYANEGASPPVSEVQNLGPAEQDSLWWSYITTRATADLNAALMDLGNIQPGKNRDELINVLLPQIYKYDAGAALQWIESVSNKTLRERLYKETAKKMEQ